MEVRCPLHQPLPAWPVARSWVNCGSKQLEEPSLPSLWPKDAVLLPVVHRPRELSLFSFHLAVNVVVVVDGNCILQYTHRQSPCSCLSDGQPLLPRRPPPTYGAIPPSPIIPRGPACGQEAGPAPSRRTRGLSVRCCTKACLGDEEEHAERHLHRAPPCSRLTPVPLPCSPSGPWFGVGSLSGGRRGARVVKIWDRQRCPLLEEGDVIAKVNGADVRDLSPGEVESVLQERMRTGDVILLVERKGERHQLQEWAMWLSPQVTCLALPGWTGILLRLPLCLG